MSRLIEHKALFEKGVQMTEIVGEQDGVVRPKILPKPSDSL